MPGAAEYSQHFDGPSPYDLIDRRSVSITATQALFLMNNPQTARDCAMHILRRQGPAAGPAALFVTIFQRPPTSQEIALAESNFPTVQDLATALLCANETIYIE